MTDRTTAELVTELGQQASRLVRDEIWLAKQEMLGKARQAGRGVGLFGAAAVFVIYAVGALVLAVIAAIALALPLWASALITGVALLLLAALAGLLGRNHLRRATPVLPVEAVDNLKEDVAVVKDSMHGRAQ
jgi:VIT1/CCC1 family predicted Fe2+/Mn2+ transporter